MHAIHNTHESIHGKNGEKKSSAMYVDARKKLIKNGKEAPKRSCTRSLLEIVKGGGREGAGTPYEVVGKAELCCLQARSF